jgi:hypothetical protein
MEVFDRDFGAASSCHWLDTDGGHSPTLTVSHAELRAHPAWAGYNHTAAQFLPAFGIPNEELVSRVEALVDDSLHGEDLYWGDLHGPAVEITRGCPASEAECTTAHVDLDLAYDTWLPDPEVDVDSAGARDDGRRDARPGERLGGARRGSRRMALSFSSDEEGKFDRGRSMFTRRAPARSTIQPARFLRRSRPRAPRGLSGKHSR